MTDYQQNLVSQATWRWMDPPGTSGHAPKGPNRMKVLITTPIALAIAYAIHHFFHHTTMAWVVAGIALFIAFSAAALPPVYAAIDRAFLKFGHWVGVGVTWLLLVPFFYLMFVPGHAILALFGKDPLARRRLPAGASAWRKHPGITRVEHFRRQH